MHRTRRAGCAAASALFRSQAGPGSPSALLPFPLPALALLAARAGAPYLQNTPRRSYATFSTAKAAVLRDPAVSRDLSLSQPRQSPTRSVAAAAKKAFHRFEGPPRDVQSRGRGRKLSEVTSSQQSSADSSEQGSGQGDVAPATPHSEAELSPSVPRVERVRGAGAQQPSSIRPAPRIPSVPEWEVAGVRALNAMLRGGDKCHPYPARRVASSPSNAATRDAAELGESAMESLERAERMAGLSGRPQPQAAWPADGRPRGGASEQRRAQVPREGAARSPPRAPPQRQRPQAPEGPASQPKNMDAITRKFMVRPCSDDTNPDKRECLRQT